MLGRTGLGQLGLVPFLSTRSASPAFQGQMSQPLGAELGFDTVTHGFRSSFDSHATKCALFQHARERGQRKDAERRADEPP